MSYVLTQSRIGPKQPQSVTGPSSLVLPYLPQRLVNFALNEFDQITGTFLTRVGNGEFTSVVTGEGVGLRFGEADGGTYLSAPVRMERTAVTTAQISHLWVGRVPSTTNGVAVRDWTATNGTLTVWRDLNKFKFRLGAVTGTSVGTWNSAAVNTQCLSSFDAGEFAFAVNGVVLSTTSLNSTNAISTPWVLHRNGSDATGQECTTLLWGVFARAFPKELVQYLSRNPWAAFAPSVGLRVFLPTSAEGVSGTASITPAAQTLTASGGIDVGGTASITPTAQTLSAIGGVGVGGTAGITPAAQTITASGEVVSGVAGTASITPAAQTVTADGAVAIGSTASITPVAQTAAGSGAVAVGGTAGITPAAQTIAASGDVVSGVVGNASITPSAQTITADGSVAVGATAGITPSAQTLSASCEVSGGAVTGTASITPSAQTILAAGYIIVLGTATITPDAQTLTAHEYLLASWRTWGVPFEDRTLRVYQE